MEDKRETIEIIDTPFFFSLEVISNKQGLKAINFIDKRKLEFSFDKLTPYSKLLIRYFDGNKVSFDFPLLLEGLTNFTLKVYEKVKEIGYGETRTYKDIATSLGDYKLSRAVGNALRINPLPIVIPCHRVIGSDGSLRGFMGKEGMEIKKSLLNLENVIF